MHLPESATSKNPSQGCRRFFLTLLLVITLGSLIGLPGCRSERTGPWVPVLEETGFSYLDETAARIRESQQQAQKHLAEGRTDDARVALRRAAEEAAVLVFYDIPITEIRQLVYDAGRLYALGRLQPAQMKLDRAAELMQQIGERDGPMVLSKATEMLLLMKDLRLAMTENSPFVAEKFGSLGHQVNMMALKSDLVLSGAHFSENEKTRDGQ